MRKSASWMDTPHGDLFLEIEEDRVIKRITVKESAVIAFLDQFGTKHDLKSLDAERKRNKERWEK